LTPAIRELSLLAKCGGISVMIMGGRAFEYAHGCTPGLNLRTFPCDQRLPLFRLEGGGSPLAGTFRRACHRPRRQRPARFARSGGGRAWAVASERCASDTNDRWENGSNDLERRGDLAPFIARRRFRAS